MQNIYFMDAPVGWLKIRSEDGVIVELDHADRPKDDQDLTEVSGVIRQCVMELEEYFSGERRTFEVPIDITHSGTAFQRKVWRRLSEIPYGETISYKELAVDCGGPTYSRAVANANGKNPVSIIIPCHRVIASDGSLGGYTGGVDKKTKLLKIEETGL